MQLKASQKLAEQLGLVDGSDMESGEFQGSVTKGHHSDSPTPKKELKADLGIGSIITNVKTSVAKANAYDIDGSGKVVKISDPRVKLGDSSRTLVMSTPQLTNPERYQRLEDEIDEILNSPRKKAGAPTAPAPASASASSGSTAAPQLPKLSPATGKLKNLKLKSAINTIKASQKIEKEHRLTELRHEMEAQLEHNVVQMSLTGLLIVDILCVVLEMVIDLDATLVAPNPEDAHDVGHVMHETSIIILFVFLLENLIMMIAIGPKEFCMTPGFVLDICVISISLCADLFVPENASVRLLFLLRLWRIARILHAFYVANEKEDKAMRNHYEKMIGWREKCINDLNPLLPDGHNLPQKIEKLVKRTRDHEFHRHDLTGLPKFKHKLHHFLESSNVQLTLVSLLLMDMCCVTVEMLAGHNPCLLFPSYSSAHEVEHYLHLFSLSVLLVFEGEICGMIFAIGPLKFFGSLGCCFDFLVVNISIAADTLVDASENKHLLVVLRIWRVLRLVHALYMINVKQNEQNKQQWQNIVDEKAEILVRTRLVVAQLSNGAELSSLPEMQPDMEEEHKLGVGDQYAANYDDASQASPHTVHC